MQMNTIDSCKIIENNIVRAGNKGCVIHVVMR